MIDFLEGEGFEVHIVVLRRENWDEAAMRLAYGERLHMIDYLRPPRRENAWQALTRRALQFWEPSRGFLYGCDDWYDNTIDSALRRLDDELSFDLAVVEYVFMSKALLTLRSPRWRVIDTHDSFVDRHRVSLAAGSATSFFSTTAAEEQRGLRRADLVLGVQEEETAAFARYGVSALTFGHLAPVSARADSSARDIDLLFVGSANDLNVEGLDWLGQAVVPALRRRGATLRIAVVGGVCANGADRPGLTKLGIVPVLADIYSRARVAVNPVQRGTGLCIKSIEALAHGLPLLSTVSGVRGMDVFAADCVVVANDAEAFADAAIALLSDEPALARRSTAALDFARTWNVRARAPFAQWLAERFPTAPPTGLP